MSTYTVTAERSGRWWVLQAVEAPGAISQVARLNQADQIKEAIAFVTGEAEDSVDIQLRPILPAEVEEARQRAEAFRKLSESANTAAAAEWRLAARALVAAGITLRDVGAILGVSFQRAQQLATAEPITIPEGIAVRHPGRDIGERHPGRDIGEIVAHVTLEPLDLHTAPMDIVDRASGISATESVRETFAN